MIPASKHYISPAELAAILSISKLTIYGWTERREVPFYKIGRLVRFDLDEIQAWLKDRKVSPHEN
jgi:DNA binding domain, excisionase family